MLLPQMVSHFGSMKCKSKAQIIQSLGNRTQKDKAVGVSEHTWVDGRSDYNSVLASRSPAKRDYSQSNNGIGACPDS